MAANKRLGESRQIELATLVGFLEQDESFLDGLIEEAGTGMAGDYEKYKISMGRYWLNGARTYLEDVINVWFAREELIDDADIEIMEDKPTTVISANKIITHTDGTKTINNVKHSAKCACSDCHPEKKAWTPSFKDNDKIVALIKEILADVPEAERNNIGFKGWLTASVTGGLGGKADPKVVLEKVMDILEEDGG